MSCPGFCSSPFSFHASTGSLRATVVPRGVRGFRTQRDNGQASRAWLPTTDSGAASPSKRSATTLWPHSPTSRSFSLLVAVEFITGLVLFSVVEGSPFLRFFVGWIPRIIDIQWIRCVHFLIMFIFVGFLHPSHLQRRCWSESAERERRDGEHLHRLEVCSPAPCRGSDGSRRSTGHRSRAKRAAAKGQAMSETVRRSRLHCSVLAI